MAVVSLKTTAITAQDAADDKIATSGPYECVLTGTLEANADDTAGSVYRMVRVPANFVPTEILLATDALGGSAAANVGVYKIEEDGGAAVDATEFASAVVVSSAVAWTKVMEEAAAADIAKIGKAMWERVGLTANPGIAYDIALTLTVATGSIGTVSMIVRGFYKAI